MNESKHSDELFDILHKTSNNTYRNSRDGTGQNFLDPTGKFQNLRRSNGF